MPETIGVGVDLCGIDRIRRAMEKPGFLQRWYTGKEREVIASRGRRAAETAAAIFAAKEAVAKALGTGFAEGVLPEDIGVVYDSLGAPHAELTGGAARRMQALGAGRVLLSLSHEGDMAAAFAVLCA